MKKTFSGIAIMTVVMMVMLSFLTGCGDSKETASVGEINSDGNKQTASNIEKATIEETIMWDNADIKITAVGLGADQNYHIVKLKVENKTSSDIHVMASRTAVNSFVVEPSMGVNVSANSTADGELKIRKEYVPAGVIADVETRFSYSSSNYSVSGKTQRVKLETSAAATFDYSYDESGTVLYDEKGIKIICKGLNDDGNPIIYMSSTGELSEGCCVEELDVYVNDKEVNADFCQWVFTNTRNLSVLELDGKDVDGNDIGKVKTMKLSFKINKENMADGSPVKTEPVEFSLN